MKITQSLNRPEITSFSPSSGWPGSIITITGNNFSINRDENHVEINGIAALLVEAAVDRLVVVAGEHTTKGPIAITVGGETAVSTEAFFILPYPTPDDPTQSGAPRFFHGPQEGTPQTRVQNQPVLVLITYPTDYNPGDAANRVALRDNLISRFDQARQYWDEVSYGSTTWAMDYSNWLPLPENRRFYFWQQEDIDDARRALFLQTSRALAFEGTRIFYGVSSGWIPVQHPNPLSYTFLPQVNTGGERTTALRLNGNRLYAGTAAGVVFVYDISNFNAPVELGSLTLPNSHITAIDISGSHLLVAGREGGIHWIDAANPAAITLSITIATGTEWAMAAKVSGTRGYVGTGTRLRVFDLSGATPAQIASESVGQFITAVDVAGNICIVATDGDGLRVFEVTTGGIVNRSAFRNVLRIRGVTLVGNLAYLAANTAGLFIVDLSNLSVPLQKSQLTTTKPCFNVALSGNEAILALGALDLLSVTVADPAAPVKNGSETPSSMEPDLGALQTALDVANKNQNLIKCESAFCSRLTRLVGDAGKFARSFPRDHCCSERSFLARPELACR
ncbi:IPT/TIG domain-containing protein [Paenibacillus elgii]